MTNPRRLALIVSALLALAAACGRGAAERSSKLVYGLTLAPTGIDPHVNASAELGIPLTSVYDTLVYRDPSTGEFVPGLAREWQISDDGLTYRFKLRTDVIFHDLTVFNSNAVRDNLDRIANPETGSQKAAFLLGPYAGTTILSDQELEIHLKAPFAPFLDSLAQVYLGMASPLALDKWGKDYQFHQVGTGPYEFVEYVPGDHLTLRKFPWYKWGPKLVNNRAAEVETIEFRFFEDPATRALALESGEVDVMGELLPQDAARLTQNPAFSLYPIAIPGQPLQIFLNTQRSPTDDLRVRQALLYATDRQAIVTTVFGGYSPTATGPLSAATWGYSADAGQAYSFDPAKAQSLLDEAGWRAAGAVGIREKSGQPLTVDLVFPPFGLTPSVAQLVEAQWKQIGVQVRSTQVASFAALQDAQKAGAYNAISLNFFGSDPDLLRQFFASEARFNWSQATDAGLDTALAEAAKATDQKSRLELYAQAQARIMDLALVVPLRDYVNLNAARAGVHALHFDAHGWFPYLMDVSLTQ